MIFMLDITGAINLALKVLGVFKKKSGILILLNKKKYLKKSVILILFIKKKDNLKNLGSR